MGAVGVLAAFLPKLMAYDVRTNEHAVRMRSARVTRETRETVT